MALPDDLAATLPRTYVVLRAFNEGEVICDVINELATVFPNIVVIDDGSTDRTFDLLRELPVHVVTHLVNLGGGAAMQTGITFALTLGAEYVITFDADGQHRVEDALRELREIRKGNCDAVYGSRFLGEDAVAMPWSRKFVLKAGAFFSNLTTRTSLTDAHNGLRTFNRRAASAIDLSQNGMAYASELIAQLARHGMVIHEVPVRITYSEYSLRKGQSSMNFVNILIDLFLGKFLK